MSQSSVLLEMECPGQADVMIASQSKTRMLLAEDRARQQRARDASSALKTMMEEKKKVRFPSDSDSDSDSNSDSD
eukprot:399283-Rhodomonas_salina.11